MADYKLKNGSLDDVLVVIVAVVIFAIIIRENSIAGLGLTNDLLAITQKYFLFLLLPN